MAGGAAGMAGRTSGGAGQGSPSADTPLVDTRLYGLAQTHRVRNTRSERMWTVDSRGPRTQVGSPVTTSPPPGREKSTVGRWFERGRRRSRDLSVLPTGFCCKRKTALKKST